MLYVLHGEDQFRAREELQRLRRQLDSDGNLANNTSRIDKEDIRRLTAAQLRAACWAASFFVENRLVIIEGLLGRFGGPRGRQSRSRRGAGNGQAGDAGPFLDVLNNLPETTTVVLLEEQAPSSVLAELKGATAQEFNFLRPWQVRPWAAQRAKEQGASFAPGALDRLSSLFDGHHLGEVAAEIDKLSVYALDRPVTVKDVDEVVSGAVDYMYWDLTDAMVEGQTDKALAVLRRMMAAREQAPQLLSFMIVRQYRQLLLAQALLQEGASASQVGNHLGVRHEFPLNNLINRAKRYPPELLERAYRLLLDSDVAVKTGVLDAQAALELLVASLAELARPYAKAATARR